MSKIKTVVNMIEKSGRSYSQRTEYYENGQVASRGTYTKSLNDWSWSIPCGPIIRYYENGQIKEEISYDDRGSREGISTYYNIRGEVIKRLHYAGDKLVREEVLIELNDYED